jgi:hypothetical protein
VGDFVGAYVRGLVDGLVGKFVGMLGTSVGSPRGETNGLAVVGAKDGLHVGKRVVGVLVGMPVGDSEVGVGVGAPVGAGVGAAVGTLVGDTSPAVGVSVGHPSPLQVEDSEALWAAAAEAIEVNVDDAFIAADAFALVDDALVEALAAAAVILPRVLEVVVAFVIGDSAAAAILRLETEIVPVVGKSCMLFTLFTTAVSKSLGSELSVFWMAFNSLALPVGFTTTDTFTEPASNVTTMSLGSTPAILSARVAAKLSSKVPFCASVNLP